MDVYVTWLILGELQVSTRLDTKVALQKLTPHLVCTLHLLYSSILHIK